MGNEVINKDILAQYVQDAVSMEVRRHTINKMRDELILSRDKRLSEQERAVSLMNDKHKRETEKAERELRIIENNHSSNVTMINRKIKFEEETINKVKNESYRVSHSFEAETEPIAGFLILGMIVGFIAPILFFAINNREANPYPVAGVGAIIGMIIGALIPYIKQRVEWRKDCQWQYNYAVETACQNVNRLKTEQQTELENYKKELSQKLSERKALSAQQFHEKTEAENEMSCEQKLYAELTERIDDISEKLETVDSQLTEFYSVNLIPPDYRSLECVIAFNQMFRNDLVDTMREAALLYDERVFRGEMIKGLNNIYKAINELGGLMSETVSVLREIESNTSRMCDELVDVSSNLVRMNANVTGHLSTMSANLSSGLNSIANGQRRIESELEYSRYSTEAIRANSDRMRWYTEQRWQGLL